MTEAIPSPGEGPEEKTLEEQAQELSRYLAVQRGGVQLAFSDARRLGEAYLTDIGRLIKLRGDIARQNGGEAEELNTIPLELELLDIEIERLTIVITEDMTENNAQIRQYMTLVEQRQRLRELQDDSA